MCPLEPDCENSRQVAPITTILGKLAMADIFLIAIYIVVAKGVGVGRLETAWGLYLFTFCVLLSYAITLQVRPKSSRQSLEDFSLHL